MVTPTATRSPAITAIACGTGDAGPGHSHSKAYTYVVNTGGAQTMQTSEKGRHDEEKKGCRVRNKQAPTPQHRLMLPAAGFSVTVRRYIPSRPRRRYRPAQGVCALGRIAERTPRPSLRLRCAGPCLATQIIRRTVARA